jgi:uncharacterized membrane protein YozB (DUF420 family)
LVFVAFKTSQETPYSQSGERPFKVKFLCYTHINRTMDTYSLIATISLLVQATAFIILIDGYAKKKRSQYRQHGIRMLISLILHISSVFTVMIPSFFVIAVDPTNLNNMLISLTMIHATFGTIAAILGVYIVASWRLKQSLNYCQPKKKIMRYTLICWLTALTAGFIMYLNFYWTSIFRLSN